MRFAHLVDRLAKKGETAGMNEELTIQTEHVDNLPVLLGQLERMQVACLLDEHFPRHGNWEGLSVGISIFQRENAISSPGLVDLDDAPCSKRVR